MPELESAEIGARARGGADRSVASAPLGLPEGTPSAFQRERVVAQGRATVGGDPIELQLPAR